jgi:hypothetical protein
MKKHLGIFNEDVISAIFSGKKRVESRFSQKKIAPFGTVGVGDIIYIKPPGKEIVGQFRVKKVVSFEGMDEKDWDLIRSKYTKLISSGNKERDEEFFKKHSKAVFGTLIFIDEVEQFIVSPIKILKSDLRGWMVLP